MLRSRARKDAQETEPIECFEERLEELSQKFSEIEKKTRKVLGTFKSSLFNSNNELANMGILDELSEIPPQRHPTKPHQVKYNLTA